MRGGLDETLMQKIVRNKPETVSLLKTQYRMNDEIMRFSSNWFYHGELNSASEVKYRSILDFDTPIVWINTEDMDCNEEFVGEIDSVLSVVKGAILVIDASKGIEVGTERVWDELRERNIPTIIFINKLNSELDLKDDQNVLRLWIDAHPVASAVIMIIICAIQVIIAFVPGEVVEIAAGYAFGAWWGAALCVIGITLGSVIVLLLAKRFGRKLVESFYPREKLESIPILNDAKKRNAIVAVLFLIPGTPKDLLTYIIGLTEMSIPLYVLLTTLSRFPSVIMSTLGGDAMGEQKWMSAIWFFIIAGIVSGLGYLLFLYIKKKTSKD
jgi:uncharacterized membrane protein YdjX (TVP38/TMEM64 family)